MTNSSKIEKAVTIAAVACCGYIALTNWDAIKTIGKKANGAISDGLNTLSGSISDAAPKE